MGFIDARHDPAALRWLFGFVHPHRNRLLRVLGVALVSTALALVQPLLVMLLIDRGILAGNVAALIGLAAAMLALAVLAAALSALNRWQHVTLSADILFALRASVFRHLESLSPAFYARWRAGDILARLDGDVAEIQRFAVDGLLASVSAAIGLVGALALMVGLSWQLSLIAFVLLPAEIVFLRVMRPRVERTTRALRERGSDLSAFLVERLGSVKFIQSVAAEEREARALDGLHGRFRGDLVRQQMVSWLTGAGPGLMTTASNALVFVIGGWMVIQGALTLGALIAFTAYLSRATGPVQSLLGLYVAVQRALVSLERVRALADQRPAIASPARPKPLPPAARGAVRFEGVRFGHGPIEVLRGVDLAIAPGGKVGLAGLSGVGKSTLIDLLQRHYDPSAGRILLDGVDLRELDLDEVRRRVAVVAQEVTLFKGSLLDNLRYAAPEASEAQVIDAARRAEVDAFARSLPEGYASDIGTAGRALSGGERQRIAIARALLQDPLVLVLDEATSAVDETTEARIIEAVDTLFADRTRIVISHRQATLKGVDRLLELADGRMVEQKSLAAPA